MTESIELAVIGAGPAGLAAAGQAAELGLSVTLIDTFALPGGQYYKQAPLRAHGTSISFTPCSGHFTRGTEAWM